MPKAPQKKVGFSPFDYGLFTGLSVPDPITFVTSPEWLDKPQLYPRQATLLKVIFLRTDLLTDYDYAVIDEWETSFRQTGENGILINIVERMQYLKDTGHKWFREVLLVMGRRAGKGYVSALAMSYVIWHYMATGNPQKHYGIDQNKKLHVFVYAGKKEQATVNLWRDVHDVIMFAPCFKDYINRAQGESLTVNVPNDLIKAMDQTVKSDIDQASIRIVPKEATLMSGRGPTSFIQAYDEFAHVVATGANRSAEEVWNAATPSLDQFKKDAFIIEPSSPWQMTGQFYKNWQQAQQLDEFGQPVYPQKMMIQLASWEIYYDWEIAHEVEMFPLDFEGDLGEYANRRIPTFMDLRKFGAPQVYDREMRLMEKADPDLFKVERRSRWQTTLDAYLDPDKVDQMFQNDLRNEAKEGILNRWYFCHIDPSETNANFGLAVGHTEKSTVPGEEHYDVCVFDYIHHWAPEDFEDHTIDYTEVMQEVADIAATFPVNSLTSDQFGYGPVFSLLQQEARKKKITINVSKATATATRQKESAESFKLALNQGWIKAPYYQQAELELKFLQLKNGKVVEQTTGPVITKDVAACMFEVVYELLATQISAYRQALGQTPLAGVQHGVTPFKSAGDPHDVEVFSQFSSAMKRGFRSGEFNPDRGGRIARHMAGGR